MGARSCEKFKPHCSKGGALFIERNTSMNDIKNNTSKTNTVSEVSNEIVEIVKKHNMSYADAEQSLWAARKLLEKVRVNYDSLAEH